MEQRQYTLSDLRKATGHNTIYRTKAGYTFVMENGNKRAIRSQDGVISLGDPITLKRPPKD
jgi:hypothetical protein